MNGNIKVRYNWEKLLPYAVLAAIVLFIIFGLIIEKQGLDIGSGTDFFGDWGNGKTKGLLVQKGIPYYPQAETTSQQESNRGFQVTLKTTDSPIEVMSYYSQQLRTLGWRQTDKGPFTFSKKDKILEIEITENPEIRETVIVVTESQTLKH